MKLIINKNDQTLLTKLIDNKINDTTNRLENVINILTNEKRPKDQKIRLNIRKQELADRLKHYKKLYGKINNAN